MDIQGFKIKRQQKNKLIFLFQINKDTNMKQQNGKRTEQNRQTQVGDLITQ